MISKFIEHPRSVDETYFEHFEKACGFGFRTLKISFVCFCHALFPWTFEHTASDEIKDLADCLEDRREKAEVEN